MSGLLPMRVLVVDDSSAQRMIIAGLLRERGHEVVVAGDGEEAWEILQRGDVQLVITDWDMPRMNGLELCRRVRQERSRRYVYVILLTVKSERTSLLAGMEAGADDFVTKPVDGEELELRVRAGERVLQLELDLADRNRELSRALDTIRSDLVFAAATQRAMLPEPATLAGFRWRWLFLPSSYVAGDIFGYFALDDDHLGFYQVDVAGHGISSALLSVTLNQLLSNPQVHGSIVKRYSQEPPHVRFLSPPEVVHELNQRFLGHHRGNQYFTMVYGVISTADGRVTLTQAGHPSPLWLERSTGRVSEVGSGGFPVALIGSAEYDSVCVDLALGDRLVLYSDGVTECANGDGEQLSVHRLMDLIEATAQQPVEALVDAVGRAVREWKGGAELEDDISLLVLEREG